MSLTTTDDSDNIVPMTAAIGTELAIQRAQGKRNLACVGRHKRVVVDEKPRTIICEDCGFVLDPFQYILDWANEGDRRMSALRSIEIQRKVAEAECADLERRIKNARSVLKRQGTPQSSQDRHAYSMARWNPNKADEILDKIKATAAAQS